MTLDQLSEKELLCLQADVTEELISRKVVRTRNNPLGDYTEWLVAQGLGLTLEQNSTAGYDGIDGAGLRIQIKGRRVTPTNNSRQMSAIRNLDKKDFDVLAAVVFDQHFDIIEALLVPHSVVAEYATYREHVNAHILVLKGAILTDSRISDFRDKLLAVGK
jgi:hypothetical protein